MENFDRENIDKFMEIRQYFPRQKFAPYGMPKFLVMKIDHKGKLDLGIP